jgi:hypothetical protein
MSSNKWMALHSLLSVIVLLTYIWGRLWDGDFANKIYAVIYTVVYFLMAFIMDKMNGRVRLTVEEVVVINNPPATTTTTSSSFHMAGEFGEIDLATDMHDYKTKIVDESGEEPEVRKTLTLFTEDTDSLCDEDNNNILLNNSDMDNLDPIELRNNQEKRDY